MRPARGRQRGPLVTGQPADGASLGFRARRLWRTLRFAPRPASQGCPVPAVHSFAFRASNARMILKDPHDHVKPTQIIRDHLPILR